MAAPYNVPVTGRSAPRAITGGGTRSTTISVKSGAHSLGEVIAVEQTTRADGRDAALAPSSNPLIPALTSRQRLEHWLFVATWAAGLAVLWYWWLDPAHNIEASWFVVNSAMLAWVTLMPAYLLLLVGRGRVANPAIALGPGHRVAMVVTKAPSEPWPMVRRTLVAMLHQSYPHDTWLADEDPCAETEEWCAAHGVSISCRRDDPEYHRSEWPRRTRC
jgi:cellulose synthase (UDP-forming)